MHAAQVFVILFAVATAVALIARWFKVPYTVALVVAGLGLGATGQFEAPHLTRDLLFAVILPGLVFEAAFHLPFATFRRHLVGISALAFPGVAVAVVLTAALLATIVGRLHMIEGFTFVHGAVFGALISATDPIAVVELFRRLGAPRRLAVLVEGESLLNDGSAVVVFPLVVAMAMGQAMTAGGAALEFARVTGIGIGVGAAVGWLGSKVVERIDEPMIEITLTVIAAYGSFAFADQFHGSGVISTVVAGMLFGNYAARHGMGATTRIAVETFWEYVAFALNSFVFLLIGLEVKLPELLGAWRSILVAYVAVIVVRAAIVFVVSAALRRSREKIRWAWSAAITWSGLRGALSMVLVLSLPPDFAFRPLLVNMTFGVVLLSILVQGLTMRGLLERLGVSGVARPAERRYRDARSELKIAHAGLAELERIRAESVLPDRRVTELEREYRERISVAERALERLRTRAGEAAADEVTRARRRLLIVEKDALIDAFRAGMLDDGTFRERDRALNRRLRELADEELDDEELERVEESEEDAAHRH